MIILIHTSKTMRPSAEHAAPLQNPALLDKAILLDGYLKQLKPDQIAKMMAISPKLAGRTHGLIASWTARKPNQRPAIDSFLGDIYSGLQVHKWSAADRDYANQKLRILSGLYGILRPLDDIYPYRLEMGYKIPTMQPVNLYDFWGSTIADTLPKNEPIINLAAVEYSKVLPLENMTGGTFTPSFLTISPITGQPTFVVVHAKIARGAYANWLIKNRITDTKKLPEFNDLNYVYSPGLSTVHIPVFVCKTFGGLGLSVRLS